MRINLVVFSGLLKAHIAHGRSTFTSPGRSTCLSLKNFGLHAHHPQV